MSATTSALIVTLLGALVGVPATLHAAWAAPPALPPEPAPVQDPPPVNEGAQDPPEGQVEEPDGAPVRSALPPGLQPVPFPLETQRRTPPPNSPPTGDDPPPPAQRRSIVDLRDPFDRPPPQPRSEGERDPTVRLLMPDLKDPFAPGVRRVRSKTLDMRVPNDIRDPFRSPPPGSGERPACVKTTTDGTVVQAPGKKKLPTGDCQPSRLDLRDPFDRADRDAKR